MKILVAGGSGATGRRLILELLGRGHQVLAVVRSEGRLKSALQELDPSFPEKADRLQIVEAPILSISREDLGILAKGCDGFASCLGHNLTLRGLFGNPRHLVRDVVMRLSDVAIAERPEEPARLVLMNTTGNINRGAGEIRTLSERLLLRILRVLLPPQRDNEDAAEYLRSRIGETHSVLRWVVVRPDSLTEEEQASRYTIHPSPTRSPIFNPGKTSRANVAHFMAGLLESPKLFDSWNGQMPVLYNA